VKLSRELATDEGTKYGLLYQRFSLNK